MNDRLNISGNIPADRAEVYSDLAKLDDAADAIDAENERMAKINASVWIKDPDFWKDELLDSDIGSISLQLATCMKEMEAAANGDLYSIGIILAQLAQIEKSALPRAESQLIDIYGSD